MAELKEIAKTLDELLAQADLSTTTSEGQFKELPDGYYLSEVFDAKLDSSSNGNPMVTLKLRVVEDGLKSVVDENGNDTLVVAEKTKDQIIYMNYVISNNMNLGFFVSDMLKFEDPSTPGKPLLADTVEEAKAFFTTTELLLDALEIISMDSRIYVMIQTKPRKDNPDQMDKKKSLISWKRASSLGLI